MRVRNRVTQSDIRFQKLYFQIGTCKMTIVFLPLLDRHDDPLFDPLHRIGPVILTQISPPFHKHCYLFPDHSRPLNRDQLVFWLDAGAEKIIISHAWAKELVGVVPNERLLLLLDVGSVSALTDRVRNAVSGVLLKTPAVDMDLILSVSKFFDDTSIYVLCDNGIPSSPASIRELRGIKATLVIPKSQLTLGDTTNTQINIADAYLAPVTSDRPDKLFPTVVSDASGHSLGLVYSSKDSIRESIETGKGVYQSRKHGLWRKGETSGATQDVLSIRLDCDTDAFEFQVIQHGAGFCHLDRTSCFGSATGIQALENTLRSRYESAPEGSYTKRLYSDPDLLRSKIMEEADELCRAESKEDVAAEAADLLYFALAKCVAAGVSVGDIEDSLDMKAKRISRRPGNAKPQWAWKSQQQQQQPSTETVKSESASSAAGTIRMRVHDLSVVRDSERQNLLRRPVLKSDEMIGKVKPIVDAVREKGDTALLELTAKYDKAVMLSTVMLPPYPTPQLNVEVRNAIDKAYANITKFHAAQNDKGTLVVETMPGVVCSRFARPIARVGLYIPGGTAILPSTAMMLGIPAQVAGCKEIVFATPPRPDGSISPEVLYVAQLVGASVILKAGGAQAVAAMAYGTESVPKVDKIFGPGNQWVTAAKMLVQNDTDALVSIDMPAGPSEVLVRSSFYLILDL
jgi:phosphoribosyl-ATP pyrophosphohydrolase / phosphoribosyl-AMP cyclohydrolase / histidinol dehydrogenase